MVEEQDTGSRKRRKVQRDKDDNTNNVIDLTTPGACRIHDIVDLTAPIPPPVRPTGTFKPKTFGDCDIVACKEDNLFDDDIVIVVSDSYRQRKQQERDALMQRIQRPVQHQPAPAASSSHQPPPLHPAPSHPTPPLPPRQPTPPPLTRQPPTQPPTVPARQPPTVPAQQPPTEPPPPIGHRPVAPARPPHRPAGPPARPAVHPGPSRGVANRVSLTVSHVLAAVGNALNVLNNVPANVAQPSGSNAQPRPVPFDRDYQPQIEQLYYKHTTHNNRKQFQCPCVVCRGRTWFLTYYTVKLHCRQNGLTEGWVPAREPAASNTEIGRIAVESGGMVSQLMYAPPPSPRQPIVPQARHHPLPQVRPPPARPPPPPARPPPARPPPPAPRPTAPSLPVRAPMPAPRPAPAPAPVEQDSSPLTCPICLDTKSQIQSSGRQVVSTTCGHVFCNSCIQQVARTAKTCPQCRKRLPNKNGWHTLYI